MPEPAPIDTLENEWIWGPTGVGKSLSTRNAFPVLFNHPNTKQWWDGYNGQDTVLIDDLGKKTAEWMGEYLKTWADHYPFVADFKGKSRMIRPKRIIVTSNYSMEEMFPDTNILEPLKRRFKQVHMLGNIGVYPPQPN